MAIAVTEAIPTLAIAEARFGLQRSDDPDFFPEWRSDLPTLSQFEQQELSKLRQRYFYANGWRLSEVKTSRAGFCFLAPKLVHKNYIENRTQGKTRPRSAKNGGMGNTWAKQGLNQDRGGFEGEDFFDHFFHHLVGGGCAGGDPYGDRTIGNPVFFHH